MNTNANEFDEKARSWDDNPEHVHRAQTVAEAIRSALPSDSGFTAMEYGCGTGLLSFLLKDRFSQITLIDNSQGMLEVINEKIARSDIRNMIVLNIDILESTALLPDPFSVIYCSMVLHHIGNIGGTLKTCYSLLTRQGYLFVVDLDMESGLFHGKDFKGHKGFDRDALQKITTEAGFVDVTFRTIYKIQKKTDNGNVHSYPVFLMTARKQ